jgi:transposase
VPHERILEGPKIAGTRRHRPWHPKEGGSTTLRGPRSTIKRWLKRRRQTGDLDIHKIPGRPSVKGEALRQWLPEHLKRNPDLTLREHCEAFEEESGVEVSEAKMSRNIARLPGEWPLKKSRR